MTSISVDGQSVCVRNQDWVGVGEPPRTNDPAFTGKVRRRKNNRFFRLMAKLFGRKKSAPGGPGDAAESRETESTEPDESKSSENRLRILESDLSENQQSVTDNSAENNRPAVDHAEYRKVTDDLEKEIELLTSENRALKEPIEKHDKTTNTSGQTTESATQTFESDASQDGHDGPCRVCGFSNGSGDYSEDTTAGKKSVSVCSNRCFADRKTVDDADANRLHDELVEARKSLAEKDKALSEMGRKIRENERYFKTVMAELESKRAIAYELYKRCELTNSDLEKERDAGLKREKKLETRIEYLRRESKRKDELMIEYDRNNAVSMRERKINLDLSKKSSESERDNITHKEERVKNARPPVRRQGDRVDPEGPKKMKPQLKLVKS